MHSTSSAFRRAAQTPHKRLNFGSGLGRPLNASSCYRRQPFFSTAETYDLSVQCLEDMRRRLEMCIYGYVVMPEHVHLLLSEPPRTRLADAIHYLKLSFAKRLRSQRSPEKSAGFWQKRYYDRNVRSYREFVVKLRYLHRNPVKRGLVSNPEDWNWSSHRHYAFRETGNRRRAEECLGFSFASSVKGFQEFFPTRSLWS